MQLALIFGIVIAAGAIVFALQNNIPVTVTLGPWSLDGSLALLLLLALGLGVLITALLSSPAVIRGQWTVSRLKRQVADFERRLADQEKRNFELASELAVERAAKPQAEAIDVVAEKPYFGLRALLGGSRETPAPATLDTPEADTPTR
ncbi:MAG: lipopolysaccharide assembly protein LapA domain-containing protein [Azonexus sp.]|nr:lipopolysaccharide assembly protein LapA domain-containing protein [Azonexus sp.]